MRLAAMVKGGYYPAAPEAVTMVGNLIEYRGGAVLDPCCGEGEALDTLSAALNVPRDKVYAIELERDRTETTRTRLEGARVIDPCCSFFDARINAGSIAVIWVNPPFDTNVKGGRAEVDFLIKATSLLMPGGILCYVVPDHVVEGSWKASCQHLLAHYDHMAVLSFPEEHRPYNEVVVIGKKRRSSVPVDDDLWDALVTLPLADFKGNKWQAPETEVVPKLFEKGGLTDAELTEAVSASPLWKLTQLPQVRQTARPPLPLAKGHIALLLASGQLDGTVCPPGEEPHVVRGTATKVEAPPVKTTEMTEDSVKTTTVIKERIQLVVRAVSRDGNIRTFA